MSDKKLHYNAARLADAMKVVKAASIWIHSGSEPSKSFQENVAAYQDSENSLAMAIKSFEESYGEQT